MPRFALSWLKRGIITFTVVLFEFALNAAPQGAEFGQILFREETCKSAANKQAKHVLWKVRFINSARSINLNGKTP